MIRTEKEYQEALERLAVDRQFLEQQRERLQELGLHGDELARAMHPALSFHDQLKEEVDTYEQIKRGDFEPLYNLTHIGRLLIGLRIARGMSQRELAERLGVSESVISRDERNEYHGISVARAQNILESLEVRFRLELEDPVLEAA